MNQTRIARDKLNEIISELNGIAIEFANEIDLIHSKIELLSNEVKRLKFLVKHLMEMKNYDKRKKTR